MTFVQILKENVTGVQQENEWEVVGEAVQRSDEEFGCFMIVLGRRWLLLNTRVAFLNTRGAFLNAHSTTYFSLFSKHWQQIGVG